jgi:hypothetical protein
MRLRSILSALIGVILAQNLLAQGKIEGAFGKRLGEVFDPAGALNERKDGIERYRFSPEAPFPSLTDYYVEVAPTSKRICAIHATGKASTETDAERVTTLLDIALRQKYASDAPQLQPAAPDDPNRIRRTQSPLGSFGDVTRIEQVSPSRTVEAYASYRNERLRAPGRAEDPARAADLWYRDSALMAEAEREAQVLNAAREAEWKREEEVRQKKAAEEREKELALAKQKKAAERAELTEKVKSLNTSGL